MRSDAADALTEQRFTFDAAAELYARIRPGYPPALIDDVVSLAQLPAAGRILEIGCGPGIATEPFASRGFRIVALEPGPQLADLARSRLSAYAVEVETTTFEDWPLQPAAFDLVMAAQSFHWVAPTLRCAKSARALVPGGALAVFANRPVIGSEPVDRAIERAYATHVPEMGVSGEFGNTIDRFLGELRESGEFAGIEAREYPWSIDYTTSEYVDLLQTYSDHRLLPDEQRRRLLAAVGSAIDAAGGWFTAQRAAVLLVGMTPNAASGA